MFSYTHNESVNKNINPQKQWNMIAWIETQGEKSSTKKAPFPIFKAFIEKEQNIGRICKTGEDNHAGW